MSRFTKREVLLVIVVLVLGLGWAADRWLRDRDADRIAAQAWEVRAIHLTKELEWAGRIVELKDDQISIKRPDGSINTKTTKKSPVMPSAFWKSRGP